MIWFCVRMASGGVLGVAGIAVIVAQLLLYPQLAKLGLRLSSLLICVLQMPFQLAVPYCGTFDDGNLRYGVTVAIMCLKCAFIEMFCTSGALMINNVVLPDQRGALSGLSATLCGPMRVLGPLLTSPLFAWSLTNGLGFPLDRSLIFLLLAGAEAIAVVFVWLLPKSIDVPLG
eukprot:SAG31_NODE_126_length_23665_cov_6.178987_17_plen_173_part_00